MTKRRTPKTRSRRPARKAAPRRRPARGAVFLARDLMTRSPITVPADMRVGALCDLLQEKNINGAPVVDSAGRLVGVVTQEDIIYGSMGHPTADGGDVAAGPASHPAAAAPHRGAEASSGRHAGRPSKRVVAMLRGRHLQEAPPAQPRAGERPFWAEHRAPDAM